MTAVLGQVETTVDRSALEQQKVRLYHRLEDGYVRIEQGINQGRDVTQWEELWVRLLREYEQICDGLARAAE